MDGHEIVAYTLTQLDLHEDPDEPTNDGASPEPSQ